MCSKQDSGASDRQDIAMENFIKILLFCDFEYLVVAG
jgi:hypothetical protein